LAPYTFLKVMSFKIKCQFCNNFIDFRSQKSTFSFQHTSASTTSFVHLVSCTELPLSHFLITATWSVDYELTAHTNYSFNCSQVATIIFSRQSRYKFDPQWLEDFSEQIVMELTANKVSPLVVNPGRIVLTNSILYYQPFNNIEKVFL
jgi:hypothetical protein